MSRVRAASQRLKAHLDYVAWLAEERSWLAGEELSLADLAAAAHLSAIDYLGAIDWAENPVAKSWYQRIKSRPSFRVSAERHCGRHAACGQLCRSRFLRLHRRARAEGFSAIGVAPATAACRNCRTISKPSLALGHHGTMAWMEKPNTPRIT